MFFWRKNNAKEKFQTLLSLPEALVNASCFVLEVRPGDFGRALSACKDLAAGQAKCPILHFGAGKAVQIGPSQCVDDASDARPVDGAGAHGTGFCAGVEGSGEKIFCREHRACGRTGEQLGVLRRVACRGYSLISGFDDHFALVTDNQGTEGVLTIGAGLASKLDGAAKMGFISWSKELDVSHIIEIVARLSVGDWVGSFLLSCGRLVGQAGRCRLHVV